MTIQQLGRLSVLGLVLLAACATSGVARSPVSPEHEALENAYRDRQQPALLDAFFDTWEREIPPISAEERAALPETQRAIYEIFEAFYSPGELYRVGDSEFGNEIYATVPLYVVQNGVEFQVVDRLVRETGWNPPPGVTAEELDQLVREIELEQSAPGQRVLVDDTIVSFRPRIGEEGKRAVYLNGTYYEALWAFLGNELTEATQPYIMDPAYATGDSERRAAFLSRKIRVWAGHWGGWVLGTHPQVDSIVINEVLAEAEVNFSLIYQGGVAFLKRTDNGWEITSSELLWIQ